LIPKRILRGYKHSRYHRNLKAFRGESVYCPCCGKTFSGFDGHKVDGDYADISMYPADLSNVVCPYCVSMPRHRILCDYLDRNKELLFQKDSKVLIFAPAYSIHLWFRRNKIRFLSTDLNDRSVDINMDIQKIPYSDNEFDFISCDHVLEHVPDYQLAISELFRVIKKKGAVEITVPLLTELEETYEDEAATSYSDRAKAFGQFDHLRMFGRDLKGKLEKAGFDVDLVDGDKCDERIVPLTAPALFDYNKIFICKKLDNNPCPKAGDSRVLAHPGKPSDGIYRGKAEQQ